MITIDKKVTISNKKNGGYYYINPDNTAVFACIDNSYKNGKESITQPFVVESEQT